MLQRQLADLAIDPRPVDRDSKMNQVAQAAIAGAERLIEDREAGKTDAAVKYLTTLSTSAMDRADEYGWNQLWYQGPMNRRGSSTTWTLWATAWEISAAIWSTIRTEATRLRSGGGYGRQVLCRIGEVGRRSDEDEACSKGGGVVAKT